MFQATLVVLGMATFSFALAAFLYYGASLGGRLDDASRVRYARRGDRLWLLGYSLLLLDPSLILVSVKLLVVGAVWFGLWLAFIAVAIRFFPRVQAGS